MLSNGGPTIIVWWINNKYELKKNYIFMILTQIIILSSTNATIPSLKQLQNTLKLEEHNYI